MEKISQKQLNKQILKQKQDQKYSNENMSHLLSTFENIYLDTEKNPFYKNEIFGFYKDESQKKKSLEEKLKQLRLQLYTFKTSAKLYITEYSKFDFPNNFSSTNLKELLDIWSKNNYLNKSCFELEETLGLKNINSEYSNKLNFSQSITHNKHKRKKSFEHISNKKENYNLRNKSVSFSKNIRSKANFSIKTLITFIPNLGHYVSTLSEDIEKEYEKHGDNLKIDISINQKNENNSFYQGIKHSQKIMGSNDEEIYKKLNDEGDYSDSENSLDYCN